MFLFIFDFFSFLIFRKPVAGVRTWWHDVTAPRYLLGGIEWGAFQLLEYHIIGEEGG